MNSAGWMPTGLRGSAVEDVSTISGIKSALVTWHVHSETTLPKTNIGPEKLIFQPSIFRCYVSFREGTDNRCLAAKIGFSSRSCRNWA